MNIINRMSAQSHPLVDDALSSSKNKPVVAPDDARARRHLVPPALPRSRRCPSSAPSLIPFCPAAGDRFVSVRGKSCHTNASSSIARRPAARSDDRRISDSTYQAERDVVVSRSRRRRISDAGELVGSVQEQS
jgi:hypothetical protein